MQEIFLEATAAAMLLAVGLWLGWSAANRFAMRRIQTDVAAEAVLLRTIIDNLPFAIFAKTASNNYKYLVMNKRAATTFCLDPDKMVGRNDYDFFPGPEADFFRRTDEQVMAGHKLVDIEAEPITTPKGMLTAHTLKVPIYDADNKPHILLGILEDITEKSKRAQNLLQAKDRAEQADRAKSEFLANMSHELRTPLNSILGMSRLLKESDIGEEPRTMAQTILGSSTTLLEIVNDILDLSKIESGSLKLEEIGFDLSYIQESLITRLTPLAIEKNLAPLKLEDSKPPYVSGDPLRLLRILTNLISNAIKYSERGQITVTVSHMFTAARAIDYRCEVADQGIGIPLEHQHRIFEKFMQADSSTTRRYGGTGLGLAITRQLVELMGGRIGFVSDVEQGSTFWVEIPFMVSDQVHREHVDRNHMKKYNTLDPAKARILLAEDNRINQVLAEKLLEKFGVPHYCIVDNGVSAVDQYRTGAWDLILMDCQMPEMSGYDATTAIRALERVNGGHIPIIAMTANAMVGDKEKCLSYGMDDYLSKPVVFEEVARLLGQWIELKTVNTAQTTRC